MFRPRVFHLGIDDSEALGKCDAEAPANPRLRRITLRGFAKFLPSQTCARLDAWSRIGRPAATSKGVASMTLTRSPNTSASPSLAMPSTPHPLQCLDAVAIRPCRARQEICRQGQPANTWYRVLTGAALRSVIKSDGRRQIVDLLFPGDFFGLTAGADYDYTVEERLVGQSLPDIRASRRDAKPTATRTWRTSCAKSPSTSYPACRSSL